LIFSIFSRDFGNYERYTFSQLLFISNFGKKILSENEIYQVQGTCDEYMKTFGYLKIENEKYRSFFEIRLDFNISTIDLDFKLEKGLSV